MLDVTRLRVLAAVARHGSVTAAAKALNYAQPSVSHHLARLEAETGTRLVERSGRGVRLTDAGRLLAGRAEEILGRLDAAEHELAAHIGQREERIRVAGFPSALATVVPAAAARLRAEHPGAELLLAEPVHLVTQAGAAPPPRTAGSPLAGYAEHRWIAGCERCRAHLLWQCELAGFTPQIAFTTDDVLVAQALAAAGLGVALLPDLALRAARHPGVRAEPLSGARRQVLALTYGEPPGPPAVECLLDTLADAATAPPVATTRRQAP